jgi:transcriptional regulator with XRE-family HTH domain
MENQIRSGSRKSEDVDLFVAQRVKKRRVTLGITQHDVAYKLGVSAAQLQKYENGINRISASRLFQLAKTLEVEVSYFYEGINHANSEEISFSSDIELGRLQDAYSKLSDPKLKEAVMKFIKELAE